MNEPQDVSILNATFRGDIEEVRELLALGADINEQSLLFGYTPLMYAINRQHTELVEFLLKHKVDTSIICYQGYNALFYAISGGKIDILLLLIKYGNTRLIGTPRGCTAVDVAVNAELERLCNNSPRYRGGIRPHSLLAYIYNINYDVIRLVIEWDVGPVGSRYWADMFPEIIQYADELDATRRKYIGRLMEQCGMFEVSLIDLILSY